VTHLRQMMLDELQRRNYSPNSVRSYIHAIEESPGISAGRQISWGRTRFASIRSTCSAIWVTRRSSSNG
jgi:hypothetical protein